MGAALLTVDQKQRIDDSVSMRKNGLLTSMCKNGPDLTSPLHSKSKKIGSQLTGLQPEELCSLIECNFAKKLLFLDYPMDFSADVLYVTRDPIYLKTKQVIKLSIYIYIVTQIYNYSGQCIK